MFKISEFSKLSQVSVKTLRYYDQLNLLKPAHIDRFSCYRYYTADQMFQLNRILGYKELGFSLEQIRELMGEDIPLEQVRGMFRMKQSEIESILEKEQAKLDRIKARLSCIEYEEKGTTLHDVVLKQGESQLVVSYRQRASLEQIPELFGRLDDYVKNYGQTLLSKLVLWHSCEECEDNIDIEVARVLTQDIPSCAPFIVKRLPEIPLMATLIHHCPTTTPCSASSEVAMWIEQNGYRMVENEPRREICVQQGQVNDKEAHVAEIQIAIERV